MVLKSNCLPSFKIELTILSSISLGTDFPAICETLRTTPLTVFSSRKSAFDNELASSKTSFILTPVFFSTFLKKPLSMETFASFFNSYIVWKEAWIGESSFGCWFSSKGPKKNKEPTFSLSQLLNRRNLFFYLEVPFANIA